MMTMMQLEPNIKTAVEASDGVLTIVQVIDDVINQKKSVNLITIQRDHINRFLWCILSELGIDASEVPVISWNLKED